MSRICRPSLYALLAGSAVLLGLMPAAGQPLCRPAVSFAEVGFSEIRNQHRTWTAALSVDASRCTTTSGRFEIGFDRLKEDAPDMKFVERFTWTPGRVEVSVAFWADEAVLDYSINYVEPCTCRN
jgi:hypothetical protein